MNTQAGNLKGNTQYWVNQYNKYLKYRSKNELLMLQAVCYDTLPLIFNKVFSFFDSLQLKKSLSQLRIDLKGKKVIDIGCGAGRWSSFFAKRGAHVTGIDIAENVIESNKRSFPHTRFEIMSAADIGFADETFDVVNAFIVLQHIPSRFKERAVLEMSRVMKANGYMFMLEAFFNKEEEREENESGMLCSESFLEATFANSNLCIVRKCYLHLYPLYGYYLRTKTKVYSIVKNLKFRFAKEKREEGPRDRVKTDTIPNVNKKKRIKHYIYGVIDRCIVRVIVCLSFFIEFIYIPFLSRGRKGSHVFYVLRKEKLRSNE